jgi:hypothetical protein
MFVDTCILSVFLYLAVLNRNQSSPLTDRRTAWCVWVNQTSYITSPALLHAPATTAPQFLPYVYYANQRPDLSTWTACWNEGL